MVLDDGDARVTRTITHELGHVFGLGNWRCSTLLQVNDMPRVFTSERTVLGPSAGHCSEATPQNRDRMDFQSSYVPIAPIARQDYSNSPRVNTALVTWDAFRVHVEKGFAVQRKDGRGAWIEVASHDPLPLVQGLSIVSPLGDLVLLPPASLSLTGEVPGIQYYRVVALTDAPLQNAVAASGEVEVEAQSP